MRISIGGLRGRPKCILKGPVLKYDGVLGYFDKKIDARYKFAPHLTRNSVSIADFVTLGSIYVVKLVSMWVTVPFVLL